MDFDLGMERPCSQQPGELARQPQVAPIPDEMLARYTTTLDNELMKIASELREAQAWGQKAVVEVVVPKSDLVERPRIVSTEAPTS
jgi:hypothetical protein